MMWLYKPRHNSHHIWKETWKNTPQSLFFLAGYKTHYCTNPSKCSQFLEFPVPEMADKISFELSRFLSTSKKIGGHRHLNTWSDYYSIRR
jgi:hypothetical protein